MSKALAVYRKELRQIARDRRTLLILVFVPAFFLLLYGYALNFDIRHVRLAVQDRDGSPESRSVVSAFINSGYFDLAGVVYASADTERLLDVDEARAVLVIPEGFARDIRNGLTVPVQVIISGDNANTATTVMGYAGSILRTASAQLSPGGVELPSPIVVEPRIWYNPELRSTLFLVPGLIAYIAMITAVASTALSIVREKEIGTMEQIRMAPIGTFSFIVGKTIPYFIIALASSALIIGASMVLFGLPMRGNWGALFVAMSLFLVGALATGLLISTVADSQQLAFQMALLISFLPTIMLSGFIFPIGSMPTALQVVTYLVPARYFLVALRGIVLKGSALGHLLPQLAALAVYASAMLALASARRARQRGGDAAAAIPRVEGVSRAAKGSEVVRRGDRCADPAADHARLRGHHRCSRRPGHRRRWRSLSGEPRADRAVRRLAQLHRDRYRLDGQ
jgi:ABC-2 type transport system permease protein